MVLRRQESFEWKIVLYLFLGGTGGGLFFIGFILEQLNLVVSLAKASEIMGPILVLIGCIFLLFHAGAGIKTKIYLLFLKPRKSWISKGTWIISIYVIGALIYTFLWREWILGCFVAIFSVLMAIYPGFLLSENKSIPFWNTPVLPVLFLFSGLSTGLAFLSLAIPLLSTLKDEKIGTILAALSWSDVLIILAQLFLLWSYLSMSSNKIETFAESLLLFKRPLFIVGTLILGLILPLVFHTLAILGGNGMAPWMGVMTGILLIIGAISLRFSILRAGVYLPRHSL